ncbi:RHS repeat-associated core domain-containing protein, partial [Corynebacterium auriscanis]|uniref:RHS repeat-associated core domain-containing protein n=1 Tax=Corynebacterium auriscanis TaxID=99807 RepID=UPI002AFE1E3C
GQYEDAESGWVYNRFRYYQPVLGSYNAQDPLGLAPRVASGQGYVDHAAHWVDVLGLASHVKNKQLQRQIDALTPQQKGVLGESIAKDRFAGQFDRYDPR